MEHYLAVLKKYTEFTGRATRSEYWYFFLFNFLIACGLAIIGAFVHFLMVLYFLYALGVLLPSLAVGIRRLHDIGKSGWWLFIALVPLLGALYLLYLFCQPSKSGS
jgi:uncharacterized membrane protein YhaH (DUF805 family)